MDYTFNSKTHILSKKLRIEENRKWYTSNVSEIRTEELYPMLKSLLKHLRFEDEKYELHKIPMYSILGLSLTLIFDRKDIDLIYCQYSKYGRLIRVIGAPRHIVEIGLNTYAMVWERNVISWF